MGVFVDLTGRVFSQWTVLKRGNRSQYWICKCECGFQTDVHGTNLTKGLTTRCNKCRLSRQFGTKTLHPRFKHGESDTRVHNIWSSMLQRCRDPNSTNYKYYGGRGITVCDRWREFSLFLSDMGPSPSPTHSIDRFPDPNGNYEPTNCRWATDKEQMRNTRRARGYLFKGESRTVADLADIAGIPYRTLYKRLVKLKWPVDLAMNVKNGESRRSPTS